jgi:alkanesulfonate monooxygenase SsuD/methylene tetrahydromethanopterin reductase-like flavin-dependent oxidoreductase (luciferase family)/putative sterol carrier protein
VRFGIFYEHQLPRPWAPAAERDLLHDALEQVEIAERAGFDCVWQVEHHFLEEYSHGSAPEVFLAAASQRTSTIRLGHGIIQVPPGVNHPARVAERVATLDLVSDGRVELGTGESSSAAELGGFGVRREHKRAQWQEALDVITRMFVEEPFAGWDGEWGRMPPRNVVPKPRQRPHPPLWVACSRRETIHLAARNALGALSFSFVEPEDAAKWVDEYYALLASDACVPAGFAVNPNVAVVLPMMLAHDEAEAIARGIDGAHFFGYSLAHFYGMRHEPGVTDVWEEFCARREGAGFARHIVTPDQAPLGVRIMQEGLGSLRGAIGTPAQVTELCRRYARAGVDQVIFCLQAGRNRHAHICESLELFGAEVAPAFTEGREELEAAKAERLAPAVAAALARRDPPRKLAAPYAIDEPAEVARAHRRRRSAGSPGELAALAAGLARAALRDRGQAALARVVEGRDDAELERRFGSRLVQRAMFGAMARAFVPEAAAGFEGRIAYELGRRDASPDRWTIEIRGGRASAHPGNSHEPDVLLRMPVADFARLAAGATDPLAAFLEGRAEVEGDLAVARRLPEMFGGPSPY